MSFERIKRFLLGAPLPNEMLVHERLPKWKALAVLSSDALSSVAYATEEVLIPLSFFSLAALAWSLPVALMIAILMLIVGMSYQQTIDHYPGGGGAYTVARENLGVKAGLVAGSALLFDYTLTVAVSISSGVENLAAAFPWLATHKVFLGVSIITLIMILNLRGVRESASIFALPTYIFIFSFLVMIAVGVYKSWTGQTPLPPQALLAEAHPDLPLFLLLRAFASGCAALTGIEAISNGIPLFRAPATKNAKLTLFWMILILCSFFLGITYLTRTYAIIPQHGATVTSSLALQIFGKGFGFYMIQGATALILLLAANTSYADFPRLSFFLAKDRFLPRQLERIGDRLVFSNGIIGLSLASIILIILFKGNTHHLIPLYAVGVFLSFTLSQSGMVVHHWKQKKLTSFMWYKQIILNSLGCVTTFVVLLIVASTKFTSGAWLVVVLLPLTVNVFLRIHGHYQSVGQKLSMPIRHNLQGGRGQYPVVIPIAGVHQGVLDAVQYAMSISDDIHACYVELVPNASEKVIAIWQEYVPNVPLTVLKTQYRSVISPILRYVDEVHKSSGKEIITIVVPEYVTSRWYHRFLHNQTGLILKTFLRMQKGKVTTTVRYHL